MIISASRIATASGSGAVGAHVFSGPKNESITIVQGSRPELDDMVRDARDHGAKYSIRHFKVNPEEATTRDQAFAVAAALGREFGFDPGRAVMVEHEKRRQGNAGFNRHWHLMVPEVDPVRGRVLDASWMRARQEKVSRVAEIELGHHQVRGKWNRAVEAALRAEGRDELADRVQPLAAGDRPQEAFSATRHQVAERRGASMPEMKAAVADAWQRSDSGPAFRTALAEQGLTARPGDKKGVWVVEAADDDGAPILVGSLTRLTRTKAEEVGARMAEPFTAAPAVETPPAPVTAQAAPEPTAPDAAAAAPEATASPPITQHEPAAEPAPEAADSAPAGRPASSPISGAPAPSSGGGGGGSDPFAGIAPLDLSKPGDWLRFLNQTANAQAQKLRAAAAAEATRPTPGGSNAATKPNQPSDYSLADAIADAIQRGREVRAERAASAAGPSPEPGTDEPNLDRRGPARDLGPDGERPGRVAEGNGPSRAVPDRVRGLPGSVDLGSPVAPAGPAGTPGEGGVAARPGDPAPRDDRRVSGPDRAARGRDRVQARRESLGLAAAVETRGGRLAELTRQVASPPTIVSLQADRARADLEASRGRIAAVLDTAPWPDSADRKAAPLQDAGRDRVKATMDARAAAAVAAQETAARLRGHVGIVARVLAVIGIQAPSVRAAADAAREAQQAEQAAKGARLDFRDGLVHADCTGTAEATRRQRDQDRWEDRPDVRAAQQEEAGNRMVVAAVESGDREIQEALRQEDGLRIARELLLQREAERLAEQQRQQLQHDRRAAAATVAAVRVPMPSMVPR